MRLEHIGIAVEDLESAIRTYEKLLDAPCYKREVVEAQGVDTAFFNVKDAKIELLGATNRDSVIATYLQKRGPGMHHVALEVDDIAGEMQRLRDEGFTLLSDTTSAGADNKRVVFLHPKNQSGVLVELCEQM